MTDEAIGDAKGEKKLHFHFGLGALESIENGQFVFEDQEEKAFLTLAIPSLETLFC